MIHLGNNQAEPRPALRELLRSLRYALRLLWRADRRLTTLAVSLTLLGSPFLAVQLWLAKQLIDAVVTAQSGIASLPVGALIAVMAGLFIANNVLNQAALVINKLLSDRLNESVIDDLLARANRLDLAFYEQPDFYDSLQRAQQEAGWRPFRILQQTLSLVGGTATLASLLVLLLRYNPLIVLALAIAGAIGIFSQTRWAVYEFNMLDWQIPATRKIHYLSGLLTSRDAAKEIRIYELGEHLRHEHKTLLHTQNQEKQRLAVRRALTALLAGTASALVLAGTVYWLVLRALAGALTIGDLTLLMSATTSGVGMVALLVGAATEIFQSTLFLRHLERFHSFEPAVVSPPGAQAVPSPLREGLVFENVSFAYPDRDGQVLDSINVRVQPGEVLALVGENGAGKTTLIKLLCRLYDPSAGRITLDGIDLREIELASLRAQFSVIFQDFTCYNATARENIGYGDVARLEQLDAIYEAARKSGADAVIEALPQQYGTMLGRMFEGGAELSGGQWQMIALARALLRRSAIVILDEPTAALSPSAEAAVFRNLQQHLAGGQIGIIVSHRFSTVRRADHILVLEHGRAVEYGRHDELIAARGMYARLYELQAAAYRDGAAVS